MNSTQVHHRQQEREQRHQLCGQNQAGHREEEGGADQGDGGVPEVRESTPEQAAGSPVPAEQPQRADQLSRTTPPGTDQ